MGLLLSAGQSMGKEEGERNKLKEEDVCVRDAHDNAMVCLKSCSPSGYCLATRFNLPTFVKNTANLS